MDLAVTEQAGWGTRKHGPPEEVGEDKEGVGQGCVPPASCLSVEPPGAASEAGKGLAWPPLPCPAVQERQVPWEQHLTEGATPKPGHWFPGGTPAILHSVHLPVHSESAQCYLYGSQKQGPGLSPRRSRHTDMDTPARPPLRPP